MEYAALSVINKTLKMPLTLVHFSVDKLKTIRPLTYWELFEDRQRGRWKGKPKEAFWYIAYRIQFEQGLREFLKTKGIVHDSKLSFLYATILGREQFGKPGRWRHDVYLTPDRVNRSFFDVVGLPKEAETDDLNEMYGPRGLERALDLWAKYQAILKPTKFMKMTIHPRIEVMTIDPIVPFKITKI
jgi:hypothetical protein